VKPPWHKAYWTAVSRGWRLRCPRCGGQPLFANLIRMHPECASCHLRYEREPGYFLGSIYINYGLTAVLVTTCYFALMASGIVADQAVPWIVTALALVFPVWFFRYARSLWLAFDHFWDPMPGDPSAASGEPPIG
jgi:uncharacterized protein (DUF983 family)